MIVDSGKLTRRWVVSPEDRLNEENMKYLLMIYSDEAADARKPQDEQQREMEQYFAYTAQTRNSGVYVSGEALHPTTTATTVRVRGGQLSTTDGPFAETKEQLGGFYLLDCKDLDEAIQWAFQIPHAGQGSVEIRPIVDFSEAANA
jgi:hypothetical protein